MKVEGADFNNKAVQHTCQWPDLQIYEVIWRLLKEFPRKPQAVAQALNALISQYTGIETITCTNEIIIVRRNPVFTITDTYRSEWSRFYLGCVFNKRYWYFYAGDRWQGDEVAIRMPIEYIEVQENLEDFQPLYQKEVARMTSLEEVQITPTEKRADHFLLAPGEVTLLLGRQKVGKTSSLAYLILEVINQTSEGSILFFAFENTRTDLKNRLLLHANLFPTLPPDWVRRIWLFDKTDLRNMRRRLTLEDIKNLLARVERPVLVILDPLAGVKELGNLVDNWKFGDVYDYILSVLLPFAEDFQVHLLLIHHFSKSVGKRFPQIDYESDIVPQVMAYAYGSGALLSASFNIAVLVEDEDNPHNRVFACIGREGRGEVRYFFEVTLTSDGFLYQKKRSPANSKIGRLLEKDEVKLFCSILLEKGGRATFAEIIESMCKRLNIEKKEEQARLYYRMYDLVFKGRERKRAGVSLEGLGLIRKLNDKTIEATENLNLLLEERSL